MYKKTPAQEVHERLLKELMVIFSRYNLILKWWTAIALFYGSNRFSEDLDFSTDSILDYDNFNSKILKELELWWFQLIVNRDSDNLIFMQVKKESIIIQVEIEKYPKIYEYSPVIFNKNQRVCPLNILLSLKIATFLDRRKSRDLYDIAYISSESENKQILPDLIYSDLRKNFSLKKELEFAQNKLELIMKEFRTILNSLSEKDIKNDLKDLIERVPGKQALLNQIRSNLSSYWNVDMAIKPKKITLLELERELRKIDEDYMINKDHKNFIAYYWYEFALLPQIVSNNARSIYWVFHGRAMIASYEKKSDFINNAMSILKKFYN